MNVGLPCRFLAKIIMRDHTYEKSQNALEQIVARHGRPIIVCPRGDKPSAAGVELRTIEVPPTVDCVQSVGDPGSFRARATKVSQQASHLLSPFFFFET